jgi:hypothetical protein
VKRLRGGRQEPVAGEPVAGEESQGRYGKQEPLPEVLRYGKQEPLPTLHPLPNVHRHASFVLQDEEEEEEEGGGLR